MALTREEITVRMGMDSSALRSEAARVSQFTSKAATAMGKQVVSLLRTNLLMTVLDLLRQIIPTAEEFWSKVYGTDEVSMKKHKEALENVQKVVAAVKKAKDELSEKTAANVLANAEPTRRARMLEDALFAKQRAVQAAKAQADELKYALEFTKGTKAVEARNEIALQYGEALKAVSALQLEQLAIEKAHKTARDAIWSAEPPKLKLAELPSGVSADAFMRSTQPFMPYMPANANNRDASLKAFADLLKTETLKVVIHGVEEP